MILSRSRLSFPLRSGQVPILAALLLFMTGSATHVLAQDQSPTTQTAESDGQPAGISERQAIIKDRVTRLEDRMFQLSQALRKAEPDKAGQLLQSLSAARGMRLRPKMDEIIKRLQENDFADAADGQKQVTEDLQSLLKLLLEGPDELEKLEKDIEKLAALKQALSDILKEQKREQDDALAAAGKANHSLQSAAVKVGRLLEQQQAITARSAEPGQNPEELAAAQAALAEETQGLAEDFQTEPAVPEKTGTALAAAAGAMEKAQETLAAGNGGEAGAPQREAEQKIAEALKSLQDEIQKKKSEDDKPVPFDKQSKAQGATTEKTRALHKQMKGDSPGASSPQGQSGPSPSGEGQDSKGKPSSAGKGKPSSGDSKKKPGEEESPGEEPEQAGAEEVESAIPHQQEAAEQLDKQNPQKAADAQEKAIEKLEQAKRQIEEELKQKRAERRKELLAALENRFRAMLARQLECNKETSRLDTLGQTNWKRSDQLALGELGTRQNWVADEADQALHILKEEGTTVVFPQVVEHVRDDARDVTQRLGASDTGESVRATQESIAETLKELIEAIEKKQAEEEGENAESPQQEDGKSPLLPGSAELKLLRSCQIRVNEATHRLQLDREKAAGDTVSPERPVSADLETRTHKLAQRQQQVHEMAKAMHESMTKAQ